MHWILAMSLGAGLLGASQIASAETADVSPVAAYSPQTLLKNWALSACLAQLASDDTTRRDADASAGAYLAFGDLGWEAYVEVDALVKQFAARTYSARPEPGQVQPALNTMKCIDLFHSQALDRLANRLVGARTKSTGA
ncbi:MAG TPA: T6SS amidase immunity protein Tai4 family protein, partial [Hydrogenophaga sp.]